MKGGRVLVGIPTRDRPEYLSIVLSGLVSQTYTDFDVMIADTSPTSVFEETFGCPPVSRFIATLRALGHTVSIEKVPVAGKSEAAAVNFLQSHARLEGYLFFFKVDDDHTLPEDTLESLLKSLLQLEIDHDGRPILVSGVTPWMYEVWEGAARPGDVEHDLPTVVTSFWRREGERKYVPSYEMKVGHFTRYRDRALVRTQLASAANFMMRPDLRVQWSDTGQSSMYADAVWFAQLQALLGYRLFFDTGLNIWHVAAPHGGVRETAEEHVKKSRWDLQRQLVFGEVLESFWSSGKFGSGGKW